jgi:circadian clock protein KaiC
MGILPGISGAKFYRSASASSGIPSLDNLLGSDGYPDKSAILIVGPPGVGKEALGYWFIHSGLIQDEFSFYVTKRSVREVIRDAKGFGIDFEKQSPLWMAREGGQSNLIFLILAQRDLGTFY